MTRWLGIDFTPTAIRVALVRSAYRRVTVEAMREVRRADHETPSAALRAVTQGMRADATATSLSGDRSFLRMIALPAAAQKEIENVLAFEVESTLPFDIEEGVLDHRVLTPIKGSDAPAQLPIVSGVAYTEEIRDRISLVLRGTGHEPQRVGVGPLPLLSLGVVAPGLWQEDTACIIDLSDHHIDVLVMRKGEPRFARSLSRGTSGLPDNGTIIARELKQTLIAWRIQGGPPIEKAYIVGNGRHIPGINEFFRSEVGIQPADLPKLGVEGIKPEREPEIPKYAKALGLALSLSRRAVDLNLRQGSLEAQQSFQFIRDKTPLLAGLMAAIFVSFGFSIFAELRALDAEHTSLEKQLEVATQAHFGTPTKDVKVAQQLLENAIKGKASDPLPEMDAFDVMVEMSRRIPKTITHDITEFDYNRGNVKIKGKVDELKHADTIRDKMAEHECFKDVKQGQATKLQKENKQKYTLLFTVDCESGEEATGKGKGKGKGKPKKPSAKDAKKKGGK